MQVIKVIRTFSSMLTQRQNRNLRLLFLYMITGAVIELATVALVVPYIEMVLNPDEARNKWYVDLLFSVFNLHNPNGFLAAASVLLAAIYAFKSIFFVFQSYMQQRVVYNTMYAVQSKLVERFLNHSYEYYLNVDSGDFLRIIGEDVERTFGLLSIVISFFAELVVAVVLSTAIFIISPGITACMVAVLAVMLVLINIRIKPEMQKYGEMNQDSLGEMNKWLLQMIQGIKEILVLRKKKYFFDMYNKNGARRTFSFRRFILWRDLPRYTLEACCMGTVFLIIGVMLYHNGESLGLLLPALAAMAMAAVRLFPAVNRMLMSLSQIAFYQPSLERVSEYVNKASNENECQLFITESVTGKINRRKIFASTIELKNVSYQYPDRSGYVLTDASLSIKQGESVGIIGRSGAGKTTLIDIMLGLLQPESGQVLIDETDIGSIADEWLANIGYIPQSIFMLDDTIRAHVAFGENEVDISDEKVMRALKEASLDFFVDGLEEGLDTMIGERGVRLSGGQRQRIGIARALYNDPDVLIFDEATSALDSETEEAILESIKNLHGKKTMLIIAHRAQTIGACDHIYKVEDGKILQER